MTRQAQLWILCSLAFVIFCPAIAFAQPKKTPSLTPRVNEPPATDPATMKVMKDFKLELIYSVPKNEQGSWVSMCVDPKGRLIVSDQYGSLYRIVPPAIGGKSTDTRIEKIPAATGMAR